MLLTLSLSLSLSPYMSTHIHIHTHKYTYTYTCRGGSLWGNQAVCLTAPDSTEIKVHPRLCPRNRLVCIWYIVLLSKQQCIKYKIKLRGLVSRAASLRGGSQTPHSDNLVVFSLQAGSPLCGRLGQEALACCNHEYCCHWSILGKRKWKKCVATSVMCIHEQ
jgi:hypothetical protein